MLMRSFYIFILLFFLSLEIFSQENDTLKLVTLNPSPEAERLFNFLKDNSGKYTLTGQHCNPLVGSTRLAVINRITKRFPALFGQDFGFSAPGTWDGINYRQNIVDEAIRRYYEGFVITLMWHAVRPTEDEPVEFTESVQGDITDEEWNDLITPGTLINERWKSQVDVIAWYLKQLKFAGVPVIWRPYHEMNGGWFWWGKKKGENGYKKLYRMLYDRLVNFHGLNNLIWVYNCNEERFTVDSYETYYPGDDVVDILATDIYHNNFDIADYNSLLKLAKNKPVAMGEVGIAPSELVLEEQPKWSWFMVWGDSKQTGDEAKSIRNTYNCDNVLTLDKLPWVEQKNPRIIYPIIK